MTQATKTQARRAKPWLERLARLGFLAKGAVYLTIGALAVQTAFGTGGETTDTQGAVAAIARQPFGQVLLAILSLGLLSYAAWRLMQAVLNPEGREGAKGIVARAAFVASGAAHLALAGTALGLLSGAGGGGSNTEAQLSATLLDAPFGRWLVGLVGLIVVGAGLFQLVRGVRASFRNALKLGEMSPRERTWAVRAGRLGYVARGVVFALVGIFFIQAARQADASEARGLDGALETLRGQPYGPWLLAAVALGFVLYGVYMGVEARYRDIYAE